MPVMSATPVKPIPIPAVSPDEVRQKIAALKQQMNQIKPDSKRFNYDPDQPLHLVSDGLKEDIFEVS